MRTFDQIKKAVESLGFRWFSGAFSLNYVHERADFVATNHFSDLLHVCWNDDKGGQHILTIPWTTKPGLKGSLLNPLTVRGITGTAVIQTPQQVIGGWEFHDTKDEFSHYPYFRQVKKVKYWRDGDKDLEIDKVQPEEEINGTHWHIMSKENTMGSGNVNNFSLGCVGAPEPEFKKILEITRKTVGIYGSKVSGTFIESSHIK